MNKSKFQFFFNEHNPNQAFVVFDRKETPAPVSTLNGTLLPCCANSGTTVLSTYGLGYDKL